MNGIEEIIMANILAEWQLFYFFILTVNWWWQYEGKNIDENGCFFVVFKIKAATHITHIFMDLKDKKSVWGRGRESGKEIFFNFEYI